MLRLTLALALQTGALFLAWLNTPLFFILAGMLSVLALCAAAWQKPIRW